MNKDYLKRSLGFHVQLRPAAWDSHGQPVDDDWIIRSVDDSRIRLDMVGNGYTVALGNDHVYSFMTNPDRDRAGIRYGFLQLLVQLTVSGNQVFIEPIPPPKTPNVDAVAYARRFAPLTIEDRGGRRYFSWRGRDPVHLISGDEPPRQLLALAGPLCEALRRIPGLEPRFNLASSIRGEIVYELSADFRAKWRLAGGNSDGSGDQVLVVVPHS